MRRLRNRLLRKTIWRTRDAKRATGSSMQWRQNKKSRAFELSLLGAINGPLPKHFNKVLVVDTDTDKLSLQKKWW